MDLHGMVDFVLGGPGRDRRDPRVSPLHGDLTRLPPTYLQVSDAEMLLDDARRLADVAPDAVSLDVFAGQQHTFQMKTASATSSRRARSSELGRPPAGRCDRTRCP